MMNSFFQKPAAVFLLTLFCMQTVFPPVTSAITIKEEETLSREFLKVIAKQYEIIEDPLINGYVRQVAKRLLAHLPPQPFEYHFYVIKEPVYNAFATPAGHIFINSGLLEAMESEDELAGILAHEIAHSVSRHISQNIDRAPKIGLATLAGIAAGVFLGIGGAAAVGNAVALGSMAAGQSAILAFSREDEMQADQLGLEYLQAAGYSAEGLMRMLKKIRSKQWFGSDQVPNYLMTHPASEDRMAFIDAWIERRSGDQPPAQANPVGDFELMRTTLIGKHGDVRAAEELFYNRLSRNPQDPLAHYGYALALTRSGSKAIAIGHFRSALEKRAFDPYLLKEMGRAYFLDGQYQKAVNALQGSVKMAPSDDEAWLFLGKAQLELGQLDAAQKAFLSAKERNPANVQTYYFLGQAYGKQQKFAEAHYYLGVHHQKKGDLKNALFHLKKAAEGKTDAVRREAIAKRIKAVEAELRKQK